MRSFFLALTIVFWATGAYAQHDICFRVDMQDALDRELFQPANGDRVILRGSFGGWVGNALELRDLDGDGVYAGVFTVPGETGAEIEFKYLILKPDSTVFWEWQPEPENAPFGNRRLLLTGNPQNVGKGQFVIDRYDLAAVGMPVMFSEDELRADFDWLRRWLQDTHCCLYAHTGKEEFDALFTQQRERIDRPMQPHEFFRIIEPITGSVGCGHTSPWMSAAYWTYAGKGLFPLRFEFMDGYAVVTGYHGDEQKVRPGSIIMEINGRPMQEIVDELAAHYSADAFNREWKYAQVARRFSMLYARRYGFAKEFPISCALPGRKTSVSVTLAPAEVAEVRKDVFPEPALSLVMDDAASAALLTVESFAYYDRVPWFRAFVDSAFAVIAEKKPETLILDVRGNDGGDPFCASYLLRYLESAPVRYFAEEYGKYAALAKPLPVAEHAYRGQLITLLDGRCFSSNGHFCSLLKHHNIGTLVGSEGGGTFTCNDGSEQCHLPATRLLVFIPRGTFATAVEDMSPDHGVRPDHEVRQRYRDYLDGRDTVMEYAMRMARAQATRE